jgi:hypothetical protein
MTRPADEYAVCGAETGGTTTGGRAAAGHRARGGDGRHGGGYGAEAFHRHHGFVSYGSASGRMMAGLQV